jgi:hypothetical protein
MASEIYYNLVKFKNNAGWKLHAAATVTTVMTAAATTKVVKIMAMTTAEQIVKIVTFLW